MPGNEDRGRANDGRENAPGWAGRVRTLVRRILRVLGVLLIVAILAIVAVVMAIDFGWQRDRILGVAERMAEAELGVPVSLGRSVGRLWRGVELQSVVIGVPSDPLLEIDALTVNWLPFSLLSRERWVAQSIRIEGWTVHLHRAADGRWVVIEDILAHLRELDLENEDDAGPGLFVRRIDLGEGSIVLVVERSLPESGIGAMGAVETPLRAIWRGEGIVRRLSVGPHTPLQIGTARFEARLADIDSGVPDFDRRAQADFTLAIAGDRVESLDLSISAPELRATARASGRFDHVDRLELEVDAADLGLIGGWIQAKRPLAGALHATALLSGSLSALAGELHVEGRDLAIEEIRAGALAANIELQEPFDVTRRDLEVLDARFDLRASALDLGPLAEDRLPPGDADLDLAGEIEGGDIVLDRAEAKVAGLSLSGSGRGDRDRIDRFDVVFQLDDLAPWLRIYRPDLRLAGPLEGKAKLAGEIPRLHGEVVLRSDALELDGRRLGALDLTASRKSDGPAVLDVALVSETESAVQAHAELDLDRERIDFDLTGRVRPWLVWLDDPPDLEAELRAEGFVERADPIPRFALSLHSTGTAVEDLDIGRIDVEAATLPDGDIQIAALAIEGETGTIEMVAPAKVALDADGGWRLSETSLEISIPDRPPGRLTLHASGRETRLDRLDGSLASLPAAIANRFLPTAPALGGTLDGDFAWTVERRADWFHGKVEWLSPGVADLELDRLTASWKSTPERIDIELATLVADRSPLAIDGEILIPDPAASLADILSVERLAFEAVLNDWDLAALEPLTPRTVRRIAGSVSGSIRVEQGASGPLLRGTASVSRAGFTVPLLRQRFEPIDGTFSLDGRRVSIDSLHVGEEGAEAELVGSVRIPEDGEPEIEGTIHFEDLPLSRSSAAWGDLRGDVRLTGTLMSPVVRGELSVENGRIGVPAADDPIMREIRIASRDGRGTLREADTPERTFRDGADLDVTIHVPSTTRVRGQGANLWIAGDLRIVKRPLESHRILGEARVVNGTYRFQGRRFRVRRGRLQFTGNERLDPILDIEAVLPVADIVAIIDVSGRLSSPIVRLLSEPAMDERDVLAYLVFGRPADEIGASNDPAFGAAAARVAAGVAETELHDLLGDSMPIDTIEVEADQLGNTSGVGVGKFIGPRLFLRYIHVLGDEPAERVGLEYRLNDIFSIGSDVSSAGDAGIDLILRHDF